MINWQIRFIAICLHRRKKMEVIAIVISICAFIVSVFVPIFEFLWNQKMNKHNLEAEYFRDMYGEIMYQKIPTALEYFHFDGNKISGTDSMLDVLREIRVRSLYFKVADETFFNKLKSAVQDLEDYIVKTPDEMTTQQFTTFYAIVTQKIDVIYMSMSNKYIGENQKLKTKKKKRED